jgi:hypothetical protein
MRIGKSAALVMGLVLILLMFGAVLICPDRLSEALIGQFLFAVGGLVTGFIGLRVTNNAVKGKCYSTELWEAEHPHPEKSKEAKI